MKVTIDVEDYTVIPTTNNEGDWLRELLIERLGANQLHLCPPAPDTAVSALEPETSRCRKETARNYLQKFLVTQWFARHKMVRISTHNCKSIIFLKIFGYFLVSVL